MTADPLDAPCICYPGMCPMECEPACVHCNTTPVDSPAADDSEAVKRLAHDVAGLEKLADETDVMFPLGEVRALLAMVAALETALLDTGETTDE